MDLTYRTDLRELNELQQARVGLLRWMFGFWATTLIAIGGLLVALRGG